MMKYITEAPQNEIITDIDGWMEIPEIQVITHIVEGREGVEVGSWFGKSTINILKYCKSLVVVDHFKGSPGEDSSKIFQQLSGNNKTPFGVFLENASRYSTLFDNKNVEIMKMTSEEAANLIHPDRKFDFVFIDGAHNYDDVKKDFTLWLPKVKPGGVFFGHDYPNWPPVNQVVTEFFGDDIYVFKDTYIWLKKVD